jgi:DNA-binding CsgD family transcriptional regulator
MNHIIVFINIIVISFAGCGIGGLVVTNFKYKNNILVSAKMLFASLTLLMLSHLIGMYVETNNLESMVIFQFIRKVFMVISSLTASYYLVMFMFDMTLQGFGKNQKAFFFIYSFVLSILSIFNVSITNIMFIVLLLYVLSMVIYYFWFDTKYLREDVVKRVKKYSILMIISLILIIIDAFIPQVNFVKRLFPYGILSLPVFMSVISVLTILELKKYFVDNSNKQYNLNMDKLIEFKITPREREVISCILEGMTYQEASDTLHISISTAKTHMNNIYKKLEVNNKLEMINKLK